MNNEPEQLELFDWKPKKKESVTFLEKVRITNIRAVIFNVILLSLPLIILYWTAIASFLLEHKLEVIIVIALIISLILLWQIPKRQVMPLNPVKGFVSKLQFDNLKERIKLQDELRKTLAQIIGGVFITIGLGVTYNTFELNRQGQIAERIKKSEDIMVFAKTKDQLGLYSLELICEDSPKNQPRILAILTSYVRAGKEKPNDANSNTIPPDQINALKNANISNKVNANTSQNTEILPLLSKEDEHENILFAVRLILGGKCGKVIKSPMFSMADADFSGLEYENAQFTDAILTNAKFSKAVLKNAKFIGAILTKANFTNADLTDADFSGADLTGAETKGAIFTNADLMFSGVTMEQLLAAQKCDGVKLPNNLQEDRTKFPCRAEEEQITPTPTPPRSAP